MKFDTVKSEACCKSVGEGKAFVVLN